MKTIQLIPLQEAVSKTVSIPGSKSYTNRALIMAALTTNTVTLLNPLISDDTDAMISCLLALGIIIRKEGNSFVLENNIKTVSNKKYSLFANLSGTTIRFILALSCIVPGVKKVYGGEGLQKRPIADLVESLQAMGAEIEYESKHGFPPLLVKSSKLRSGEVVINGNISSQFLSAILMISPIIGDLIVNITGKQISKSYVDITLSMMREWGIKVINDKYEKYIVTGKQEYNMNEYIIEGDYSAASYFAAIGKLTNSNINLKNLRPDSVQGDRKFIEMLSKMGNAIEPLSVDMEECPDQAQTMAVLLAFADGTSTLTGVRSLRVKETERVKALQTELGKMGIKTESPDEDTLIIHGGNPHAATIDTYGDHRMAMSFAVAGAKLQGMKINNPEVVNKTFPSFWEKLEELGIKIKIL